MLFYSLFSDLPSSGPKILGVDSKYHVGDQIIASCFSPLSFPLAVLRWYINSDSADPSFISNQSRMDIHPNSAIFSAMNMKPQFAGFMNQRSEADRSIEPNEFFHVYQHSEAPFYAPSDKIEELNKNHHKKKNPTPYSVLKLNFTVKHKHLAHTEGGLSLKCTAEVQDLYWCSSEVDTNVASPPITWSLLAFVNSIAVNTDIRSLLEPNMISLLIAKK